jgi:hypothetical protein
LSSAAGGRLTIDAAMASHVDRAAH